MPSSGSWLVTQHLQPASVEVAQAGVAERGRLRHAGSRPTRVDLQLAAHLVVDARLAPEHGARVAGDQGPDLGVVLLECPRDAERAQVGPGTVLLELLGRVALDQEPREDLD